MFLLSLFIPSFSPSLSFFFSSCIPFQTSNQGSGIVSGNCDQSNRNNFNYSETILTSPPQTILLTGDIDFTDTSNIHSTLDQRNSNNVICDTTTEVFSSPSGFVTSQSNTADNNPTMYTNSNKQPRSALRNQPSYSTAV